MSNLSVLGFLLVCECTTTWFLVRLCDFDVLNRKANKAKVLKQLASLWEWIRCLVCNRLVVCTSFIRVTHEWNTTLLVGKQDIFYGVTLFLAAITRFLFIVVLGACDWSFSAIVIQRGADVSV